MTQDYDAAARLRHDIEAAVLAYAGIEAEALPDARTFLGLIEATQAAIEECADLQKIAVHQARRADNSWASIGELLGTSRQAAQQRFAAEPAPQKHAAGEKRITGATAFNEMELLKAEGAAGYHLVDFGGLYLTVKASSKTWEHRREIALSIAAKRARLEKNGWIYVGEWFPFHYFKRMRG